MTDARTPTGEAAFDSERLKARLVALGFKAQLAFLLSCAERLFPNYAMFHAHHRWGDIAPLRDALELGWKQLEGDEIERKEIVAALVRCLEVLPDMDEFGTDQGSDGLDAAVCCALVLDLLISREAREVIRGASLARDTADRQVLELASLHPQDAELEAKVLAHPLMQKELARQREDVELLEKMDWSAGSPAASGAAWRERTARRPPS